MQPNTSFDEQTPGTITVGSKMNDDLPKLEKESDDTFNDFDDEGGDVPF